MTLSSRHESTTGVGVTFIFELEILTIVQSKILLSMYAKYFLFSKYFFLFFQKKKKSVALTFLKFQSRFKMAVEYPMKHNEPKPIKHKNYKYELK